MTAFVEVLPPELTGPAHPEWFEARRQGITASEIAAVLGLSPHGWETPFSLYWAKKAGVGEEPDNAGMRWGRRLESYLVSHFADGHGEFAVSPAGLYASAERPWQLSSPDGLVYDSDVDQDRALIASVFPQHATTLHLDLVATLECKTDYSWDEWGPDGTDEIPVHYRAQVLWQMDTLGVEVAYLPVAVGRSYREYTVAYDKDDAKLMREAAESFLARLANDDPPPVDGGGATLRTLKALHPAIDDTEAQVPARLAQRWQAAVRSERAAKDRRLAAENALRARMGRSRRAVHNGQRVATRSVYEVKEHVRSASTVDKLIMPKEKTG